MTTAALLPTPGDPFLARYWVRNYEQTWKGEADELVVLINGPNPEEAAAIFRNAGARVHTIPHRIGHGEALGVLTHMTDADTLLFMEDDAFVREPGAIREHLRRASEGEVIGSPRGGMHPTLEVAARDKWGPVTGPDTSSGHGLWPCFLFTRREFLPKRADFGAGFWGPGDTIPGLDYTVGPEPLDTDTMTAVAFWLRANHPITLVGQWKELDQKRLPKSGAPWFHAGGLSNFDDMPRENCGGTNEGRDWAHRVWWWLRTSRSSASGELSTVDRMNRAVRIINHGDLSRHMAEWDASIPPWINWAEQ